MQGVLREVEVAQQADQGGENPARIRAINRVHALAYPFVGLSVIAAQIRPLPLQLNHVRARASNHSPTHILACELHLDFPDGFMGNKIKIAKFAKIARELDRAVQRGSDKPNGLYILELRSHLANVQSPLPRRKLVITIDPQAVKAAVPNPSDSAHLEFHPPDRHLRISFSRFSETDSALPSLAHNEASRAACRTGP